MKPKIVVTGLREVRLELRTIAERVPDTARKTLRRTAEKILLLAKMMAPRDIGNLENAIKLLDDRSGQRGRLQIDIAIVPTGEEVNRDGKLISVDQYAALVHENYESVTRKNGMGRRSKIKQLQNPDVKVGGFFITRAGDEYKDKLPAEIFSAVQGTINEVMK